MLVNILVLAVLLLKLVDLYMIMEVSSNGNSASNTTPHSFTSSEHSRKRKQGCKVVTTLSAVAPANGDQCIRESIKRNRVEDLSSLDSTKPTCLHGRFAKRVFTRGNQSSQREVWPLSRESAISAQQPALESEEEVAEAKAKLLKGLGLFDSDSVIPGIYRDSGITGEAQWQSFERQEQLIRQSQGHANVQFAWPSLENEEEFMDVKDKLIKGLGVFGSDVLITGIYRDTSSKGQARQEAFERLEQLTREHRGYANVQYAWHGSSKAGVSGIILHGFGQPRTPRNGSAYGVGVYLAPENHAEVSAVYADNDENGEQHMLLCRVILGTAELVKQGSDWFHPSSENFDTGVDDLSDPKRLIIWSTHMNTHILPLYVVSFKLSPKWHNLMAEVKGNQRGISRTWNEVPVTSSCLYNKTLRPSEEWYDHVGGIQQHVPGPTSPCVSFPCLFQILRQQLLPGDLNFLEQQYVSFKTGRLRREQLIKVCRDVAGDARLVHAIRHLNKCQKAKEQELLKIQSLTSLPPTEPSFA